MNKKIANQLIDYFQESLKHHESMITKCKKAIENLKEEIKPKKQTK
jgi:hypothetical protein